MKAGQLARAIKDERGGKPHITVIGMWHSNIKYKREGGEKRGREREGGEKERMGRRGGRKENKTKREEERHAKILTSIR